MIKNWISKREEGRGDTFTRYVCFFLSTGRMFERILYLFLCLVASSYMYING